MGYGNVMFKQPNNDSSFNKLRNIQYNAALAITRAIQGTH